MKKIFITALIALFSINCFAQGIPTSNFFPAPNSTLQNTAGTSATLVTFTVAAAIAAPDVLIVNGGTQAIYCDIGLASAGFTATTVPTNTIPGGFLVQPSQASVFNKRANDTVACITSASTAIFTATPGIGN